MSMLVFTDLDATLLDHATYSAEDALPMLAELARRSIPVIPVTSKTRAEVRVWRERLDLDGPYVTENGAGVFVPSVLAGKIGVEQPPAGGDVLLSEPIGYTEIRSAFRSFAKKYPVVGFGDLTMDQIAVHTGLSLQSCALASQREFSEPFLLDDLAVLESLEMDTRSRGLRVLRGGRFFHLLDARAGKGVALRLLCRVYEKLWGKRPTTFALGDSPNDLEMLHAADRGIVVPHPGGVGPGMVLAGLEAAPHPGPRGWAEAVRRLVG